MCGLSAFDFDVSMKVLNTITVSFGSEMHSRLSKLRLISRENMFEKCFDQ